MLRNPLGDVVERHLDYARCAGGTIHMVTYASARHRLKPQSFEERLFVYPSDSWSQVSFPLDAYRSARELCRAVSFDAIYTQDPFGTGLVGVWLRKKFNIPLIIGNHSSFIDNPLWIRERPLYFTTLHALAQWVLPQADAWRVINHSEKEIYIKRLRIPPAQIAVINTPVSLQHFAIPVDSTVRRKIRHNLGLSEATPVALWVGRPVKFKRLPILLKAFRIVLQHLPEARLVLIGPKKLQQENLEAIQSSLELNKGQVIWLDEGVPHAELPVYYQMANVYVHSSNYEGFGKVLVEAAASGLPLVVTEAAGPREIVQDGETGFLVQVDDSRAMARRMIDLLTNLEKALKMGNKGRSYVLERFNRDKNIDAIVALWRCVAEAGVGGRPRAASLGL
jgi:glycosyltransferase involved in cell wall biosynthesis